MQKNKKYDVRKLIVVKKIKFLFCILLVFLFFNRENVYAAQELTCIYKGGT